MRDLLSDPDFPNRQARKHDASDQVDAFRRLAQVFAESPDLILQELVEVAVKFCGAESAGISLLEEVDGKGTLHFRWIAVAGSFSQFVNGTAPRFFSPCGITLNASRPQLYRVTQPYYDFLGIQADAINDGILIPWQTGAFRGTIWAVSHGSRDTFDLGDFRLLSSLADFAAVAVRHQAQQQAIREQQEAEALKAAINRLAHEINNPLQSLTNFLHLASRHDENGEYLDQATEQLERISALVADLLSVKTVAGTPRGLAKK